MFDQQRETPGQEPPWLGALTELFGADPQTGWMDSDAALEAMGWLARQVFAQSRTDRGCHTRAGLEAQVRATARVSNSLAAVQAVRIAQFAATSVDHAVLRRHSETPHPDTTHPDTPTGPDSADGHAADREAASGVHGTTDPDSTHSIHSAESMQGSQDGMVLRWLAGSAGATAGDTAPVCAPGTRAGDTREVLHPLGHQVEFADTEIGAAMCWGPMQATRRVQEALDVVTATPRLLEAMGAGHLDAYRAAQATGELVEAGTDTCQQVEEALLQGGITEWTSRRIQARTRALVGRLDPAAMRTLRRKRARDAINVIPRPGTQTGTTEITAVLWSAKAHAAFAAIDQLAHALHADTTTDKTLGQCRADAMVDLILDRAHIETQLTLLVPIKPHPQQATPPTTDNDDAPTGHTGHDQGPEPVSVAEDHLTRLLARVDWDTELDRLIDYTHTWHISLAPANPNHDVEPDDLNHDDPNGSNDADPPEDRNMDPETRSALGDAYVPGIGVIPATQVRAMLRDLGVAITRVLVDSRTGTVQETTTGSYRPTAGIRRMVERRDQHCRFPGCDRPARWCDIDHITPWPHGPTRPQNLQLLCRHHHRAKHEGGWHVTMTPDGLCHWTSPTGQTYTTHPGLLEVTSHLTITPGHAPLEDIPCDTPEHGRTSLHDP